MRDWRARGQLASTASSSAGQRGDRNAAVLRGSGSPASAALPGLHGPHAEGLSVGGLSSSFGRFAWQDLY